MIILLQIDLISNRCDEVSFCQRFDSIVSESKSLWDRLSSISWSQYRDSLSSDDELVLSTGLMTHFMALMMFSDQTKYFISMLRHEKYHRIAMILSRLAYNNRIQSNHRPSSDDVRTVDDYFLKQSEAILVYKSMKDMTMNLLLGRRCCGYDAALPFLLSPLALSLLMIKSGIYIEGMHLWCLHVININETKQFAPKKHLKQLLMFSQSCRLPLTYSRWPSLAALSDHSDETMKYGERNEVASGLMGWDRYEILCRQICLMYSPSK